MRAQIVAMTSENLDMDAIKRAGDILKAGGLVAFPTETVYGLGGNALDPQASMKIYAAKGRPSDNPLIVHIAEIDQLAKITTESSTGCKDSGGEILAGSTDNDPSEGGHCTEGDDRRTGQCGCPFP